MYTYIVITPCNVSTGDITKSAGVALATDYRYPFTCVARDGGYVSLASAVQVRVDTFSPELNVVGLNTSMDHSTYLEKEDDFLSTLQSTLFNIYPKVVVRRWKLDIYTVSVALSSGRRRLLQTSSVNLS